MTCGRLFQRRHVLLASSSTNLTCTTRFQSHPTNSRGLVGKLLALRRTNRGKGSVPAESFMIGGVRKGISGQNWSRAAEKLHCSRRHVDRSLDNECVLDVERVSNGGRRVVATVKS